MPEEPATEAWMVVGRRGGKNFILALIAVYLAAFRDWRPHLAPGEWGTVMVIASDRRQARVTMRYVKGLLENVPMLARLVVRETAESIDLANQITIEVHTASFRSVRGYTVVAALLDEVAFWRSDDESANPDREVVEALRSAMATVPGAILLAASSPYARRGVLWETWQHHYGKDEDPLLVWQADTRTMNPSVPQRTIDAAYERARAGGATDFSQPAKVYYGEVTLHEVLERTAWHSGQHTRQLMLTLKKLGIEPDRPMTGAEFSGLPLPEDVWDNETTFD